MTSPRTAVQLAFGLVAALAVFGSRPASGQPAGPSMLTPWQAPALRADAYSTDSNPAALTFVDGFHSAVTVGGVPADDDRVTAGWNIAGGFGRIAGFGFGIEGDGDAAATTLGFGAGSAQMAVGYSTTRWFSDSDRATDGFSTSRLSLAARASNNVGASFTIHELMTPRFDGTPLPRRYVPAVSVRTSNGSVELDVRFEAVSGASELNRVGATLLARPTPGLRLFASTDMKTSDPSEALGASFGLELSGGYMTATGAATLRSEDGELTPGFVTALEFSSRPAPSFVRRDRFVRVDLSGTFDEAPGARLLRAPDDVFVDLLLELDEIARDPSVGGVFLNMGGLEAPTAQLYELRQAVRAIQARGKTVVAYFERATLRDLYVAGGADVRIADPTLSVLTAGIGVTRSYLGDFLSRLGMQAYFVRIGDYKSGPERFTESGPSEPADEQLDAFLDDVWGVLLEGIAENFGLSPSEAEAWLAEAPLSAADLEADGYLADILYRDELDDALDELVGRPVHVVSERRPDTRSEYWVDPNVIAVIHISGAIVMGRSADGLFGPQTGAETIVEACRELAEAPEIRGVVVRIDSPGGSALASDRIHRALTLLAESKPVVVSMGSVAASGGIYAASFGEEIHAVPTTLTGSIGIYAGTVALDGLLAHIGINREHDDRGTTADLFDGRPWDEETTRRVYEHIEDAYARFVQHVADSRGMSFDDVDAAAQGRIWSGSAARDAGLVDGLGGFLGALESVRNEADIRRSAPVTLRHFPIVQPNMFSLLPSMPGAAADGSAWADVADALGLTPVLTLLGVLVSEPPGGAMAQLEWVIEGL